MSPATSSETGRRCLLPARRCRGSQASAVPPLAPSARSAKGDGQQSLRRDSRLIRQGPSPGPFRSHGGQRCGPGPKTVRLAAGILSVMGRRALKGVARTNFPKLSRDVDEKRITDRVEVSMYILEGYA